MSDPTLGFQVDTSGLDKGADSLDKVTQSAAKTEDQASKTSAALNKMGETKSDGLSKTAKSVDQLAASLVKASGEAQKHLNVSQALDSIVAKTGASYTQANAALSAAVSAHKNAADATNSHGKALDGLAGAAGGVVPPINSIAQAAAASGSSIGGLTSALTGGTLALGGIAAAAAGAVIELVKTGDELKRQESRWSAITGSTKAGAEAFNQIKQAASSTGVEFSSLSSFVEKASQGIDKLSTSWPVITVGANKALDALREMGATLGKVMQTAGATAAEESQVFGALAANISKGGGLTADTFEKIRDTLPQVARAIASAFGVTDINAFQKALERQPKSLQDLEEAIKRIKPALDAAFDPNKPKTFEQGIRGLSIQWNQFLEDLAKTGAFDLARDALAGIGKTLKSDIQDALAFVSALNSVSSAAGNAASSIGSVSSNVGSVISGKGQGGSDNAQYDAMGNVTSSGGSSDQSSPYAFDNSSYLSGLDHYATGGSFTVGGSGGTDSQLIQFMATPGEKVSIDPPGKSGDAGGAQTLGSLLPAGGGPAAGADIASTSISDDFKSQTAALSDRINASTSSITAAVNTSAASITAGIKSIPVGSVASSASSPSTSAIAPTSSSFGGAIGGGGGGGVSVKEPENSDFSTKQKRKTQNDQPDQVVPSYNPFGNTLAFGKGRSIKGYSGSDAVTSAKTTEHPLNPLEEQSSAPIPQAIQSAQSAYSNTNPYSSWKIAPPLEAAKDYMGGPSTPVIPPAPEVPPIGNPMGDGWGLPKGDDQGVKQQTETLKQSQDTGSKTVADQVKTTNSSLGDISKFSSDQLKSLDTVQQSTKDGTDATKADTEATTSGFGDTKSGLDGVKDASAQTNDSVGQTTDAVSTGSGNIVDSVQSMGSTVSDAVTSAISSIADMVSSNTAAAPSDNGTGSTGVSSDGGFSSGGEAQAVADGTMPAFATGGQFSVSGQGGTDSQHVEFMATPGEVVTITPPGGQAPHSPTMGSPPDKSAGGIKGFATGGQFEVGGTLGGAFGAPTVAKSSADLITAHVSEMLGKQETALGTKIDSVGQNIIEASNASTTSIKGAIGAVASSIPDPVAPTAAAPSTSSGSKQAPLPGEAGYNIWEANDSWSNYLKVKYGAAIAQGGAYQFPSLYQSSGGQSLWHNLDVSRYGASLNFATGGQFSVSGQGGTDSQHVEFMATPGEVVTITPPGGQAPHDPTMGAPPKSAGSMKGFATGGQFTVGNDNAVSTDALSSSLSGKTQSETAKISDHISAMGSKISASISGSTNTIIAGVNAIGSRFNAWHSSVNASAKTASGVAPFSGMAEGGTFIVPGGTSGNDSVEVGIKASPGERIMVIPPEKADQFKSLASTIKVNPEPLSKFMPDTPAISGSSGPQTNWKGNDNIPGSRYRPMPSMMPDSARATVGRVIPSYDPSANPDRSAKNVNIFVQQGIQADQFIRSRAEIQRSMSR